MTAHAIRDLGLGSWHRQRDGLIVTAREQKTGATRSFHEIGAPTEALTAVAEHLDAMEGDWKVVSIATPASIYRDLQGMRGEFEPRENEARHSQSDPRKTEHSMLGRIGRLDLLQPLQHPGPDPGFGRTA